MKHRLAIFITLFLGVALASPLVSNGTASALSGSDWQAGRIIDQPVFRNNQSMSVQDIQNFLNAKVPACDTWGAKPSEYGGGTRAQYGQANGAPPPYTCLKDYSQGGKSAAKIIYDYANQYKINPQVLITVLQKEQSLVTDDWPWPKQYRSATGYGCPDSAACDSQYYGFDNQVRWAARMYQAISDNDSGWYSPYLPGNNYIRWNPTSSCGGSNVWVDGRSTAALYSYTPYQPNATALSNIYGSQNDGCSSFGNRNFWRLFNDWFGSTVAPPYGWQPIEQSYYTNSSKTVRTNSNIPVNGSTYLVLKAKNIGSVTWSNTGVNPINLATLPDGRNSAFCATSWLSCNRPARLKESSVAPGETGTFEFTAQNNNLRGVYREYFTLVSEGRAWFNNPAMNFYLTPQPAVYTWSIDSQQAFTDNSKSTAKNMWAIKGGESAYLVVKAKNTGNMTWSNTGSNPIKLGTWGPSDRASKFCMTGWNGCGRAAIMKESSVAPGQTATFEFPVTAPMASGDYIEHFNLLAEGRAWMNDTGLNYYIKVQPAVYSWSIESQQAFTDSSKSTPKNMWAIRTGQTAYLVVRAKNTGNMPWANTGAGAVKLGTWNPNDRVSKFCMAGWNGCSRAAIMSESSVNPGEIGTFQFPVTAPATGNYIEHFNLLSEGRTWMRDTGLNYYIKVQP